MSPPPEPPDRLAEILLEILALSDSTRTSESKSEHGSNLIELYDPHRAKEQTQRENEEAD